VIHNKISLAWGLIRSLPAFEAYVNLSRTIFKNTSGQAFTKKYNAYNNIINSL